MFRWIIYHFQIFLIIISPYPLNFLHLIWRWLVYNLPSYQPLIKVMLIYLNHFLKINKIVQIIYFHYYFFFFLLKIFFYFQIMFLVEIVPWTLITLKSPSKIGLFFLLSLLMIYNCITKNSLKILLNILI